MKNVLSYKGNANQHYIENQQQKAYIEILFHPSQNGYHQENNTGNVGKDAEEKETLCTVGRNENWCSHYGNQYADA
jgi:hypothetical protein